MIWLQLATPLHPLLSVQDLERCAGKANHDSRAPLQGYQGTQRRFEIRRDDRGAAMLPTASTCFNALRCVHTCPRRCGIFLSLLLPVRRHVCLRVRREIAPLGSERWPGGDDCRLPEYGSAAELRARLSVSLAGVRSGFDEAAVAT